MKRKCRLMTGLLSMFGIAVLASAAPDKPSAGSQPSPESAKRAAAVYGKLPLSFEPNRGQTSEAVQWLSRGPQYTLYLTGPDAVLQMNKFSGGRQDPAHAADHRATSVSTSTVRMNLLGASEPKTARGEEPQSGRANYITGKDSSKWQQNVPMFGRVRMNGVYPGIDVAYYGHQGSLEYDFIVAPGADASAIKLRFDGAKPKLAANGDLLLPVEGGTSISFNKPVVYQMVNGVRRPVDGSFTIATVKGERLVQFRVGKYDRSRELVIDPTLVYTGTFGTGSAAGDAPSGMAVDAFGELLITGTTLDLNFPATQGAYQTSCGPVSSTDTANGVYRCANPGQAGAYPSAFVMKLSADGTQLVYATYLHGLTGGEQGSAIQADAAGNAVVVGETSSADFPLVHAPAIPQMSLCQPRMPTDLAGNPTGPPAESCNGYYNGGGTEWTINGPSGFVAKLSADGSTLLYGAFLGFSGTTYPRSLALDSAGNMYILSNVNNADHPIPNVPSGEVYYPTTLTAFQQYGVGDTETALTVLSADGQTILYSTIYGETENVRSSCGCRLNGSYAESIALGQNGTVFIAGETAATTLPGTANSVQPSCVAGTTTQCSGSVGFIAAFNTNLSGANSLLWATYVSGVNNTNPVAATQLNSIAADAENNVYLTGWTGDALFPITAGAYATTCPLDGRGGANICDPSPFVSKLNSTGTAYVWSTFLAPNEGTYPESGNINGIALDPQNNVYLYGDTAGLILPAINALSQYPNNWYQPYPFLAVLNPTGTNLLFSSQVAPNNNVGSMQNGLALDPSGNIYMVGNTVGGQDLFIGNTTLTSWPTTPGTYTTPNPAGEGIAFFVKISPVVAEVTVPNVVGSTQTAASSAITGVGLTVGTVTMAISSTVPSGTVISESPSAGTSVAPGSAVNLVVSAGALGPVSLTTTSTIHGSAATGYTVVITITNSSTGAASGLTLTAATLGSAAGTPLPQTLGVLAPGASATFTVRFPGSAGADGAGVPLKYSGTVTGGTISGGVRSLLLP